MGPDDQRCDCLVFKIKEQPQVCLDHHRKNSPAIASGKTVDLVCSQSDVKWIVLENQPSFSTRFFLLRREPIKTRPEFFCRPEAIFHCNRGGGVSNNAFSIGTQRPCSASSIASLNSAGIQAPPCSTTNLATAARSAGGRDLICSMISCALIPVKIISLSSFATGIGFHEPDGRTKNNQVEARNVSNCFSLKT